MDYEPGTVQEVEMHDGSKIRLKKTERDYDATDMVGAIQTIKKAHDEKQFLTGLLYINENKDDFVSMMDTVDESLATLPESMTRPGKDVLESIMKELM